MTRQLKDHHVGTPCPVCSTLLAELAALRLALTNVTVERDAAQQEAARLPQPRYSEAELNRELVEL
jgi:hypothetical protein